MHSPERRNQHLRATARRARARAIQSQLRTARLEQINLQLSVLLESFKGEEPVGQRPEPSIRLQPEASRAPSQGVLTK